MKGEASTGASPLLFFALLFAFAVPIWLASPYLGVIGALRVPTTDLALTFTPLATALVLRWREAGPGGGAALLARAFDVSRIHDRRWLLLAAFAPPLIYLATTAALHLEGRGGQAQPHWAALPVMSLIVFVLAIGEEVGWTGYAIEPMQARWGALGASLLLAIPWWLGHLPSILEIGGTGADMAWWLMGAAALRVLMTWLYNNAGRSLFAVVLFHTMLNVGRFIWYPTIGAHYDPAYQAVGYLIASLLAVFVVIGWGPRTLAGRG